MIETTVTLRCIVSGTLQASEALYKAKEYAAARGVIPDAIDLSLVTADISVGGHTATQWEAEIMGQPKVGVYEGGSA